MYDGRIEGEDVMQQGTRDRRLTYDDVLLSPDDGQRHELIDGKHYVTPSPNARHQVLLGRLYFEIELFLRAHSGSGRVFLSPLDVVFSTGTSSSPICCSLPPIMSRRARVPRPEARAPTELTATCRSTQSLSATR